MAGTPNRHYRADSWLLDPKQSGQLRFKVEQRLAGGRFRVRERQSASQQVVELWRRMIGLCREIQELDKVRRERNSTVFAAKVFPGIQDGRFPQGMQVAFRAPAEGDLARVKEIERAGKPALRSERAFRDGFDFPMVQGKPSDDEAGVTKPGFAQHDGWGCIQYP